MIKLTKVTAGHYKYGIYEIVKWKTEMGKRPYLWCLAINGVGLDDFTTLAKVKKHIIDQESKWDSFAKKVIQ